eukprot:6270528-Pyramimonas_sp.AAC.1
MESVELVAATQNIPTLLASDWSVVRIYPRCWQLIGPPCARGVLSAPRLGGSSAESAGPVWIRC